MSSDDEMMRTLLDRDAGNIIDLIRDGISPLAVAAARVHNGLMIYKTVLDENEFNNVVKYIVQNLDRIPKLDPNSANTSLH
jgi:hypothetical protein